MHQQRFTSTYIFTLISSFILHVRYIKQFSVPHSQKRHSNWKYSCTYSLLYLTGSGHNYHILRLANDITEPVLTHLPKSACPNRRYNTTNDIPGQTSPLTDSQKEAHTLLAAAHMPATHFSDTSPLLLQLTSPSPQAPDAIPSSSFNEP